MNDEFIVDLWSRIKHMIPTKERLHAADTLVAVCDQYGFADGLEECDDLDKELRAAVKSYFLLDEENEVEDDRDEDEDYDY